MTRVYLLRHGTAAKAPGQSPHDLFSMGDMGLDAAGRAEAAAAAHTLAAEPLDAVYASHAVRAQETAHAVAGPHGLSVHTDERLIEVSFGAYGGAYRATLQAILDIPVLFERDPDPVFPNGERHSHVLKRGLGALDAIADRHATVAVVAHGLFNRFILAHLQGSPPGEMLAMDQGHACVNVLDRSTDGWHVRHIDVAPGGPLPTTRS